ncbi:MAG TPA: neutral zinc metallopeptidase, partial [Planctomycetaceae bacterium]|nr:neutral zinc metallopeptidase [Planctomycetaceae bacterium]
MRWKGRRGSSNVEDQRRASPRAMGFGGGIVGFILVLVIWYMGGDPRPLLQNMQQGAPQEQEDVEPINDEMSEFVSVVLADTEAVWTELFRQEGMNYNEPKLLLFRERIQSACGFASLASGPFYCPGDSRVYLDVRFFDEMRERFNAPGDFAQAYVIAHEVGHHVQHLMGLTDRVHEAKGRVSEEEYNQLSVRLELQADYFAGVWAHHAEKNWSILEEGDIDEALNAASAIGDDRLQKQAQGYVVPDSFTHGTSL